jgi:hypothetical protein
MNEEMRETKDGNEAAFDEALKKAMIARADELLSGIDQNALLAATMKKLPKRAKPRSFASLLFGFAHSFKMTQAAVAAAVIAVISFAAYEAYELSAPDEIPQPARSAQSATIEDVKTENAAAMIAEGKGEALTVIWIIEEE